MRIFRVDDMPCSSSCLCEKLDIKPITKTRLDGMKMRGIKAMLETGDVVWFEKNGKRSQNERYVYVAYNDMNDVLRPRLVDFDTENISICGQGWLIRYDYGEKIIKGKLEYVYYFDCIYVSDLDENLNGDDGNDFIKLVDVKRAANVPKPIQFDYINMHTFLNPNVYSKHFKSILKTDK